MDSQILSELYYSIYEDQEVLDEGIVDKLKNKVFGDPKSPAAIKRAKDARAKQKEALARALANRNKPEQPWGQSGSHGYSDKAMFKEDYCYILEYLVTEGFVNTLEDAEVVFDAMSTEWIDEILSESI